MELAIYRLFGLFSYQRRGTAHTQGYRVCIYKLASGVYMVYIDPISFFVYNI